MSTYTKSKPDTDTTSDTTSSQALSGATTSSEVKLTATEAATAEGWLAVDGVIDPQAAYQKLKNSKPKKVGHFDNTRLMPVLAAKLMVELGLHLEIQKDGVPAFPKADPYYKKTIGHGRNYVSRCILTNRLRNQLPESLTKRIPRPASLEPLLPLLDRDKNFLNDAIAVLEDWPKAITKQVAKAVIEQVKESPGVRGTPAVEAIRNKLQNAKADSFVQGIIAELKKIPDGWVQSSAAAETLIKALATESAPAGAPHQEVAGNTATDTSSPVQQGVAPSPEEPIADEKAPTVVSTPAIPEVAQKNATGETPDEAPEAKSTAGRIPSESDAPATVAPAESSIPSETTPAAPKNPPAPVVPAPIEPELNFNVPETPSAKETPAGSSPSPAPVPGTSAAFGSPPDKETPLEFTAGRAKIQINDSEATVTLSGRGKRTADLVKILDDPSHRFHRGDGGPWIAHRAEVGTERWPILCAALHKLQP